MKKLEFKKPKWSDTYQLVIPIKLVKSTILAGIKDGGLYSLNSVFGEDAGHGCGIGGEDISYEIKDKKYKYFISINYNGKELSALESVDLYDQNGNEHDSGVSIDIGVAVCKIIVKKLCPSGTKLPNGISI